MCQPSQYLLFCTCTQEASAPVHNKNSRRAKKTPAPPQFLWQLKRLKESKHQGLDGMVIMPQSQLSERLTAHYVETQLNQGHCFDFDYQPQPGDNLLVFTDTSASVYMSYIFKNQQWTTDYYDPFYHKLSLIEKGKIKCLDVSPDSPNQ